MRLPETQVIKGVSTEKTNRMGAHQLLFGTTERTETTNN
jgi:hypothetical protein